MRAELIEQRHAITTELAVNALNMGADKGPYQEQKILIQAITALHRYPFHPGWFDLNDDHPHPPTKGYGKGEQIPDRPNEFF